MNLLMKRQWIRYLHFTFPFTILFSIKQRGVLYLREHETVIHTFLSIGLHCREAAGAFFLRQHTSAERRPERQFAAKARNVGTQGFSHTCNIKKYHTHV